MNIAEAWLWDEALKHRIALDGEAWLAENDDSYEESAKSWRHSDGKDCDPPGQEVPTGGDGDLEVLVEEGAGQWLQRPQRKPCSNCTYLFSPNTPWQRFCREACKKQAKRKRQNVPHS